jgi:hypothetical protein
MFNHYSNPVRQYYKSAVGAFGATTATRAYIGPPGKRGMGRTSKVFLTADAVGTAAVPEIDVGSASGLVEYAATVSAPRRRQASRRRRRRSGRAPSSPATV